MTQIADSVVRLYRQSGLMEHVTSALTENGVDIERLSRGDITAMDEFHIRGSAATRELAQDAGLAEGMHVLDVGCGVGGTARTIADEFGCRVTGVDLVDAYCELARWLTEKVGLGDRITYEEADATSLPFEENSFDALVFQHIIMNIPEKNRLIEGFRRVVTPGGTLACYEVCSGDNSPIHFPVPWAEEESISFLVSPEELRSLIRDSGFAEHKWVDVTEPCRHWFERMVVSMEERPIEAPRPVGVNLLMGQTTLDKSRNMVCNLSEDRVRVVVGIFTKTE